MTEPQWLPVGILIRLHDRQIELHGGLPGLRDAGLLESAATRPVNGWAYGETDLFYLAAKYAGGLIGNHPFLDGNKRIGFLAALLCLELNGWKMAAPLAERLAFTLQLAASEITETDYADWLRRSCTPV